VVKAEGMGGMPVARAQVSSLLEHQGSSRATLTLTAAQTYLVSVSLGGKELVNSPHTLLVRPAGFCASMSTLQGGGLSVAAVAPRRASFVIQARDSFGNARTHADASSSSSGAWQVRLFRANSPLHYLAPFPPQVILAAPDAYKTLPSTRASLYDTGDGRVVGSYMLPAGMWSGATCSLLCLACDGCSRTCKPRVRRVRCEREGRCDFTAPTLLVDCTITCWRLIAHDLTACLHVCLPASALGRVAAARHARVVGARRRPSCNLLHQQPCCGRGRGGGGSPPCALRDEPPPEKTCAGSLADCE
jgi:hypothetical protein